MDDFTHIKATVLALKAEGLSPSEIARRLPAGSASRVTRILWGKDTKARNREIRLRHEAGQDPDQIAREMPGVTRGVVAGVLYRKNEDASNAARDHLTDQAPHATPTGAEREALEFAAERGRIYPLRKNIKTLINCRNAGWLRKGTKAGYTITPAGIKALGRCV